MTSSTTAAHITLRDQPRPADVEAVREIVASTGFFHDHEIAVAVELVQDRLTRGEQSDYRFLFADAEGTTIAYTCYGPIACTVGSYDLYWIAVHDRHRSRGLGRRMLVETESRILAAGGRNVYVETSSRPLYEPTRRFYLACRYKEEARLADFYAPGDGKIIYAKAVA